MNGGSDPSQVTHILRAAGAGDAQAARELLPLVYAELRRLAESRLKRTPPGQTLQATALVHEAYLRLIGKDEPGWRDRGHFFFAAARAIQDILVESARKRSSLKRGGDRRRIDISKLEIADEAPPEDLLAFSEALAELEIEDAAAHKLIMLRFFAGLTEPQAAEALGISERTARREWRFARVRLLQLIDGGTGPARAADPSDDDDE